MHDEFYCTEIKYKFPTGKIRVLYNVSSISKPVHQCTLCATEAQAVSGCLHRLYQCDDGSCISPATVCDGKWDCVHGDDETNCDVIMCHINNGFQNQSFCQTECSIEVHSCLCGLAYWQCKIAISKYCDHQEDCQDASDEALRKQNVQMGRFLAQMGSVWMGKLYLISSDNVWITQMKMRTNTPIVMLLVLSVSHLVQAM